MVDPLKQFMIKPIVRMSMFGVDISFTNASLAVLFCVLALTIFFFYGSIMPTKNQLIPTRLQAARELCYNLISDLVESNIGYKGKKYIAFVFSIFFFILTGNLLGMIPGCFTFTSHIIATFTLAMMVFLFTTILGFVLHGKEFLSLFVPRGVPTILLPLLVSIEVISYLSRPLSLSIRLFANMMGGHTMLKVFAGFSAALGIYGIAPLALNIALTGFELAVAYLQAYVFTILTCLYINDAVHLH